MLINKDVVEGCFISGLKKKGGNSFRKARQRYILNHPDNKID
jgi:hypothetical protein